LVPGWGNDPRVEDGVLMGGKVLTLKAWSAAAGNAGIQSLNGFARTASGMDALGTALYAGAELYGPLATAAATIADANIQGVCYGASLQN
jgi:hypothetical protein